MTADELAEKLLEMDAGRHLPVWILNDGQPNEGDDSEDYDIREGYVGNDIPMKVVLFLVAKHWKA